MTAFWNRIRRRKLVHWGLAYLAGAWLFLQVLDLLGDTFEWSPIVQRVATVLLGIGFLAALVLAWYHGEKGEQRVSTMEIGMLAALLVIAGAAVAFVGGGVADPAMDEPRIEGNIELGGAPRDPAPAEQGSIAVLPFADMSAKGDQEYFSDGLAEELLNVLARLPELRVASRTSAFAYKGTNVSIDSIARALRVAHVLEGSVRKAGEKVRITAQLIDARTGYHLWSDSYDRDLSDVFAVQDEIARAIVEALQIELGGGRAGRQLAREETKDPDAYTALLRGLHFVDDDRREGYAQAAAHLEQAIAHDPDYARAHAELARVYSYQAYRRWGPREELIREARKTVQRALALDPDLAQAHHVLGQIAYYHDWDFAASEAHYRRAIELNPGLAQPHSLRGWMLVVLGRTEEGIAEAERALELDPVSAAMHHNLGGIYTYADRLDRALEAYTASLVLRPEDPSTLIAIAQVYAHLGRHAEAIDAAERARARAPEDQWALAISAYVHGLAGRRAEAERMIRMLEARPEPAPYLVAAAYAGLGQADRVFALLERAVAQKDATAPDLGVDPIFDPFRGDPRMRRLLQRMGLPAPEEP